VSFAAITLCVASQQVIPKIRVYFVRTLSGNFWIHSRIRQSATIKFALKIYMKNAYKVLGQEA
jgi:hypothetical protein